MKKVDSDLCPLTYLYVKTHNITGLKYVGRTESDPFKYIGSGSDWLRHLVEYGPEHSTMIIGEFTSKSEIQQVARDFSIKNNVAKSELWANKKIETGYHPSWASLESKPRAFKKRGILTEEEEAKFIRGRRNIDNLFELAINPDKFEKGVQSTFCFYLLLRRVTDLSQSQRDQLVLLIGYAQNPLLIEELRLAKKLNKLEKDFAIRKFWRDDHSMERRSKANLNGGHTPETYCDLCRWDLP